MGPEPEPLCINMETGHIAVVILCLTWNISFLLPLLQRITSLGL